MSEEQRSAAQLMYDAFRQTEKVVQQFDDLMMFEKNGVYYVGHEDHFFVGGFPYSLADDYYYQELMQKLVVLGDESIINNIIFDAIVSGGDNA